VIGTTAGSYRIIDVLSVGGMGTVYRAEHTLIGRLAAVKVLHPELSANPEIVTRFFNEAKATTSIKHPGIVEIYDFGNLPSGHAYLVMEFLEGRTLAQRNKQRGALPEAEAAALLRAVCSALGAAHARGIVHRDLKPDNIFLVPDQDSSLGERPKILDFGIAKLTDIGLAGSATKTGAVMGTPTYMSPEQCKGTGDVDHRADLYSIGCMFYEMVCGRPPFTDRGAGELIGAHLFVQPEPPSQHGAHLSPDGEAVIMALLAKNPAQRPQTAVELAQLLANIASRGGYGSSTNWERPSMPGMSLPDAPTHYTPSHTPASVTPYGAGPATTPYTPAHYTPGHTPAPGVPVISTLPGHGPSSPNLAEKPTTLSGSAGANETPPKRGSKKLVAVLGGLALVGGMAAAFFAVSANKSGSDTSSPSAASQPSGPVAAPTAPDVKPAETTPTETQPAETTPAEVATPTEVAKPTEAKPAEAKPAEAKPAETKPAEAKPAETKPAETKPTDTAAEVKKPKPTGTGVKPKPKPKTKDPLLETDL